MTTAKHIVRSYDEELDTLHQTIVAMGRLANTQIGEALRALNTADTALARKVVDRDEEMNALHQTADQQVLGMLAKRQPLASDLRVIVASQKIASELERIADYAANIAGHAVRVADSVKDLPLQHVASMVRDALQMLSDCMQVYDRNNAAAIGPIWQQDENINAAFAELIEELSRQMTADAGASQDHTAMLFIGRSCERIGDHIKNMAEHLHYMSTGESFFTRECT
ncbi:MAG: phosphate signaling complex protein PhoU [Desulfosarcinaceae bacterium]|nr:phosphate signaling complex protein PhoU [Desulfosarcinaceae bacterium]